MTDGKLEELIGADVDGELGPAEQARVDRLLAQSEQLVQLRDGLARIRALLNDLPRARVDAVLASRLQDLIAGEHLAALLRDLPRERAPARVLPAVIERLKHAPTEAASRRASRLAGPARLPERSHKRRWLTTLAGAAALLATAALLVVLPEDAGITLDSTPSIPHSTEFSQLHTPKDHDNLLGTKFGQERANVPAAPPSVAEERTAGPPASNRDARREAASVADERPDMPVSKKTPIPRGNATSHVAAKPLNDKDAGGSFFLLGRQFKNVHKGSLIPVKEIGLVCDDVERMRDRLRVVLTGNQIDVNETADVLKEQTGPPLVYIVDVTTTLDRFGKILDELDRRESADPLVVASQSAAAPPSSSPGTLAGPMEQADAGQKAQLLASAPHTALIRQHYRSAPRPMGEAGSGGGRERARRGKELFSRQRADSATPSPAESPSIGEANQQELVRVRFVLEPKQP